MKNGSKIETVLEDKLIEEKTPGRDITDEKYVPGFDAIMNNISKPGDEIDSRLKLDSDKSHLNPTVEYGIPEETLSSEARVNHFVVGNL